MPAVLDSANEIGNDKSRGEEVMAHDVALADAHVSVAFVPEAIDAGACTPLTYSVTVGSATSGGGALTPMVT